MVPRSAPWLDDLLADVMNFTGHGDDSPGGHMDALCAAYDELVSDTKGARR